MEIKRNLFGHKISTQKKIWVILVACFMVITVIFPIYNVNASNEKITIGENEAANYHITSLLSEDEKLVNVGLTLDEKENATIQSVVLPDGTAHEYLKQDIYSTYSQNGKIQFIVKYINNAIEDEIKESTITYEVLGIKDDTYTQSSPKTHIQTKPTVKSGEKLWINPTVSVSRKSIKVGQTMTSTLTKISFDNYSAADAPSCYSYAIYGQSGYMQDGSAAYISKASRFKEIRIPKAIAKDSQGIEQDTTIIVYLALFDPVNATVERVLPITQKTYSPKNANEGSIVISEQKVNEIIKSTYPTLDSSDVFHYQFEYRLANDPNISPTGNIRTDPKYRMSGLVSGDIEWDTELLNNGSIYKPGDSFVRSIVKQRIFSNNSMFDPTNPPPSKTFFQSSSRFNSANISVSSNKSDGLVPGDEIELTFTMLNDSHYINSVVYFGLDDCLGKLNLIDTNPSNGGSYLLTNPWKMNGTHCYNVLKNATVWKPIDIGETITVKQKFKIPNDYKEKTIVLEPEYFINGDNANRTLGAELILKMKTLNVHFDVMGGIMTNPVTQEVLLNDKVVEPTAPTKDGYTFVEWYKDINCTQKWDFSNDIVTEDVTLYAGWEKTVETEVPTEPDVPIEPEVPSEPDTPIEPNNPSINHPNVDTSDHVNILFWSFMGNLSVGVLIGVKTRKSKI